MNLLFTTDLGIKTLIYMALNQKKVSMLADMSRIFQVKRTTFKRPFNIFLKNKVICSHAGRTGGLSLALKPSDIYLGNIIKMLEPNVPLIWWMKTGDDDEGAAIEYLKSTYHLAIEEAETSFFSILNRYTIADLANDPIIRKALKIEHLVRK